MIKKQRGMSTSSAKLKGLTALYPLGYRIEGSVSSETHS